MLCLNCGKKLRRYKWRIGGSRPIEGTDPKKQFGDYGDNRFCGINCGYGWANTFLNHQPAWEEKLQATMEKIMAEKG